MGVAFDLAALSVGKGLHGYMGIYRGLGFSFRDVSSISYGHTSEGHV